MNISILQTDTTWLDPKANLAYLEKKLSALPEGTDLLVLPEMFSTGFTMNVAAQAESMSGLTLSALIAFSSQYDMAICGSLLIQEDGHYYNRFVFVKPSGEVDTYDKRHLFSMGGEQKVMTAGTSCSVIEYKGWRIKPQVCYDLRFPVWSRNTEDYDLLIYVANWPKPRIAAFDTLLQARAIENQAYVCACNRIGEDGNGLVYTGHSQVIDAKGKIMADAKEDEAILSCQLSKADLEVFRQRFPVLEDGDFFQL